MRRESSTVVVLVGAVTEPLLAGLARSSNVSLVRPPDDEQDGLTAAALALGQAARRRSPFVLVPADPLAGARPDHAASAGDGTGMYLGPLRAARPRRVEAVVSAADGEAAENTERVLQALRTLRHGPWWPPLDELTDRARHFFAGSLVGGGPPSHDADARLTSQ